MINRLRLYFVILSLGCFSYADRSLFEGGRHCVAYRVKKRTVFFSSTVVGKNCDIAVQLAPVVGGEYQVEVSVPISGFDSGDRERDADVRGILKESEQSDLLFRSKPMSEGKWREAVKKSSLVLEGELNIAGRSFPISTQCQIVATASGVEVDGVIPVSFAKFDLKVPKVGGGLIVKADSDLELHFHIRSDKMLGADKALPEKAAKEVDEIEQKKKKEDDDDDT